MIGKQAGISLAKKCRSTVMSLEVDGLPTLAAKLTNLICPMKC